MIGQWGALGVVWRLVLLGVWRRLRTGQAVDFRFRLGFGLRGGEFGELQFQLIHQLSAAFGTCAVAVVLQARDEFLEMSDGVLGARQCCLFGSAPCAFGDEGFLACDIGRAQCFNIFGDMWRGRCHAKNRITSHPICKEEMYDFST